MQGNRRFEIFQLLRESVGQSRESAAVHPQCVILFLDVARGN